ncbi:MAG: hypothetical protein M1823_005657 [Watsoniomyces obsoletus]|nr:MAG: hypothetical protein M1823_005657 [Watsoniomyces obsoletus]
MVGRTNYIALVGGGEQPKFPPNKVIVWDDSKQKVAITLEFITPVQRVRISRSHIVVVLRHSVSVHRFATAPEKISTFKTSENPLGLCCLGNQTLAFPGRTSGQVQLVQLARGEVSIIPAHSAPLRAMELSSDGGLLATASETGTLIRVYSVSNCACVAELRRGVDQAIIFDLAISPSNTFIAVTSDKSTLHIFDLPRLSRENASDTSNHDRQRSPSKVASSGNVVDEEASRKWGILGKIPLMPRVFSDNYSFASAPFEIGDERPVGPVRPSSSSSNASLAGTSSAAPSKGMIGWTSEKSLIVIGAGRDARWERFIVGEAPDGRRYCVRDGWRKYLGGR